MSVGRSQEMLASLLIGVIPNRWQFYKWAYTLQSKYGNPKFKVNRKNRRYSMKQTFMSKVRCKMFFWFGKGTVLVGKVFSDGADDLKENEMYAFNWGTGFGVNPCGEIPLGGISNGFPVGSMSNIVGMPHGSGKSNMIVRMMRDLAQTARDRNIVVMTATQMSNSLSNRQSVGRANRVERGDREPVQFFDFESASVGGNTLRYQVTQSRRVEGQSDNFDTTGGVEPTFNPNYRVRFDDDSSNGNYGGLFWRHHWRPYRSNDE